MRNTINAWGLRVALGLLSAGFLYTGIDNAFGGVMTLGLQGLRDFAQISDPVQFAIRDSHVRFLGGVYMLMGVAVGLSAIQLRRFHDALRLALIAAVAGGLARFTQLDLSVTFGPGVLVPLLAELVLMPLLYVWAERVARRQEVVTPQAVTVA
jgi:Domain of unknown function (DUF4345)